PGGLVEGGGGAAGGGTALLAVFAPSGSMGFGQGLGAGGTDEGGAGGEPEAAQEPGADDAGASQRERAPVERLAPWARLAAGLEEAWETLRARLVGIERATPEPAEGQDSPSPAPPPAQGPPTATS